MIYQSIHAMSRHASPAAAVPPGDQSLPFPAGELDGLMKSERLKMSPTTAGHALLELRICR